MSRNELMNHPTIVIDWAIAKERRRAMLSRSAKLAIKARASWIPLIASNLVHVSIPSVKAVIDLPFGIGDGLTHRLISPGRN
jgi:hypothetical protein